jgi:hypothetical protein
MAIKLQNLDKASVLAALYNASKPQGMGHLQKSSKPMTKEEAQGFLDSNPSQYFDYLGGRVLKIDLSKDELETWLYDRDNGQGAAEKAIATIR